MTNVKVLAALVVLIVATLNSGCASYYLQSQNPRQQQLNAVGEGSAAPNEKNQEKTAIPENADRLFFTDSDGMVSEYALLPTGETIRLTTDEKILTQTLKQTNVSLLSGPKKSDQNIFFNIGRGTSADSGACASTGIMYFRDVGASFHLGGGIGFYQCSGDPERVQYDSIGIAFSVGMTVNNWTAYTGFVNARSYNVPDEFSQNNNSGNDSLTSTDTTAFDDSGILFGIGYEFKRIYFGYEGASGYDGNGKSMFKIGYNYYF